MGGVYRLGRLRVGPVDLVYDDDRPQAKRERLTQHDSCLRHWAFGGIDEQQAAVRHAQNSLDLATKVRMAGGVDDVELHPGIESRWSWRGW